MLGGILRAFSSGGEWGDWWTTENHGKKWKNKAYFEKIHEKQGKNITLKYNVFIVQHIHDTLMAFFILDESND